MSPTDAKNRPLVSVVIPSFKREDLALRAIKSALSQSVRQIEVLVIDNDGNGQLGQLVRASGDSRVRYECFASRRGGSAARNYGVSQAQAGVVAFLDDDDVWDSDKLARQLPLLESHDAVVCGYRTEIAARQVMVRRRELKVSFFRGGNIFPTSALVARTKLLQLEPFDESLPNGQDWDLYFRVAQRGPIANVARPLFTYNDGEHLRISNRTREMNWDQMEERLRAIKKHSERLGSYWTRYRMADELTSHFRQRAHPMVAVRRAVSRCGTIATAHALMLRLIRKVLALGEAIVGALRRM